MLLVEAPTMVFDLRRRAEVRDHIGSCIGWCQPPQLLQGRTIELYERDGTTPAMSVLAMEVGPGRFGSRPHWHPVKDAAGELIGYAGSGAGYSRDGTLLLGAAGMPGRGWSLSVAMRSSPTTAIASAVRLGASPDRPSTIWSRFGSERLRVELDRSLTGPGHRRLAIASLLLAFIARNDE